MDCLLGFLIMNCFSCLNDYLKHLKINCMLVFILFLLALFWFGLKVLKFNLYLKGFDPFVVLQNGLCSKTDLEVKCCNSNTPSGKLKPGKKKKNVQNLDKMKSSKSNLEDDGAMVKADFDEDNVFDVLALRKLVKIERQRANSLYSELEKERMAAATSAEEAMAMILRLQNEKSLSEMEAKQYKRLAKEKQLHDQEVILSLQWLVLKHESAGRSLFEDQLKLFQQKLKMQSNEEDKHENFEDSFCSFEFAGENGLNSRLFSSLDMDLKIE